MAIFKCGTHDFSCDLIGDWRKHCESESHKYTGRTACFNCGSDIKLDNDLKVSAKNAVPKLLCEECKAA